MHKSASRLDNAAVRDGSAEFRLYVLIITAFYLGLVWSLDFPPLQDYAMRMFIAFASSTFEDPAYNWADFFRLENNYGSYSFTFWFIRAFAPVAGIETAGKLFLSAYVCAVAAFVLIEARSRETVPWALLMIFPLAFNQTYILGLMGYFFAVPFLFIALRHLRFLSAKPLTPRRLASHMPLQAVIFFCHPFVSALYAAFAGIESFFRRGREFFRSVFIVCGFGLFFALWYLTSSSGSFEFAPRWWPVSATLEFSLLVFTGMKITNGPDWVSVALWCMTGVFVAYAALTARSADGGRQLVRADLVLFFVALAGLLALPFSPGAPYTYFNVRLVAVVYFLGAVVVSNIHMRRFAGRIFAALMFAVVLWQGYLHLNLSREIAEIKPVISRMEKNSVFLPVIENGSSARIDPVYFYQFHDHAPEYYHFLVGGGANPYLINDLPALPIHYNDSARTRKMLEVLQSRSPRNYSCCYRYIVARGDRLAALQSIGPFRRVVRSGKWALFDVGGK